MKNRFKLKGCFIFALILTLIISTMPVFAFAETTDQWVTKAPMSTSRQDFQTAVIDGKIYAIGGQNEHGTLSTVEEYNPLTDIWTAKASMSTSRTRFQTIVVNEKIYAIGGIDSLGAVSALSTVEEYDPATDKWTTKAPLSFSRRDFRAELINGKIYVLGGDDNGNSRTIIEEYDVATNTWKNKAALSKRKLFGTIATDGKIYIVGGLDSDGRLLNSVQEYDPVSNVVNEKESMITSRHSFQAEAINGEIYVVGGRDAGADKVTELFNPIQNKWTEKAPMMGTRYNFQTKVINGNLYAFGGDNHNLNLEVYDPNQDKWVTKAPMLGTRYDFESAFINGKIYAIGGFDGNGFLSSVEEYTPVSSQPDAPTTLTATAGDKQVSLSWSPVAGATGYNIYRSTTSGSNYTKIASDVISTTYTDTGLTNGVTYYYYVTAIDSSGVESQPSNGASATPAAPSSGGYNATLKITMVTGEVKEYNVNSTDIESFITWFNSNGSDSPVFTFEKTSDLGPYTSHTDYLAYDKISSFIVLKY
ncbi:hypothetical protein [Clostridium sp. KNHs216]|uniref:Kelch repeat-containing protein n=1 Tax=Clostridium sp. KNHs216 TaxID=1550235 RepID=UPI0011706AE1|nr:hypothetical protein [Clostridium sp. KNHs216]TQI65401.1 Kelch motif protein [Clostridium sp. KNHs216]